MKPYRLISLAMALALGACQQEKAAEPAPEATSEAPDTKTGLSVSGGKLMLPAVKGNPGAAYFILNNGGDKAVTLAAVTIEGAGKTEMHETKGGTMSAVTSVEAKPGEAVTFERGGRHVMAFDLADSVAAGGKAEMTLTFADGDKLSVPLAVEAMAAADGMDHGAEH